MRAHLTGALYADGRAVLTKDERTRWWSNHHRAPMRGTAIVPGFTAAAVNDPAESVTSATSVMASWLWTADRERLFVVVLAALERDATCRPAIVDDNLASTTHTRRDA